MATFINQIKNSETWATIKKAFSSQAVYGVGVYGMATYGQGTSGAGLVTNQVKYGSSYGYILTDASDYILVGSSEDETLIWQDLIGWVNQVKS